MALLKAFNIEKSYGSKVLFENLGFNLDEGEKVALIGRNGYGKTTLFKIVAGEEKEFYGQIEVKKGTKIVLTKQEHFLEEHETALDYILKDVPKFIELENTLLQYEKFGEEKVSLEDYCDALTEFSELGYYELKSKVLQSLNDFQVDEAKALSPMKQLSGGQKRFVELVRVMYSEADLALIDEPTNHMDYVGKEQFIKWLKETKLSLFIVSHDRDVLKYVDKILELKNREIEVFNGNYDHFIKTNSVATNSDIKKYENDLKRVKELKKQILDLSKRGLKDKSIKVMEDRFKRELERLEAQLEKPSFWIDKGSLEEFSDKVVEKYHKYKEKNIKISHNVVSQHKKLLVEVSNLSLGYDLPLFEKLNMEIFFGDKFFVKGRNGAGKSTLIKAIISSINNQNIESTVFEGKIQPKNHIRVGVYEQEVDEKYLNMKLGDAIIELYYANDKAVNNEKLNSILGNYLFEKDDADLSMKSLSGGQKARFQLIKMFVNDPNLIILDEPTNHLDLPSIEELEDAINAYQGGVIYISHDSYFIENMGGTTVEIK